MTGSHIWFPAKYLHINPHTTPVGSPWPGDARGPRGGPCSLLSTLVLGWPPAASPQPPPAQLAAAPTTSGLGASPCRPRGGLRPVCVRLWESRAPPHPGAFVIVYLKGTPANHQTTSEQKVQTPEMEEFAVQGPFNPRRSTLAQ